MYLYDKQDKEIDIYSFEAKREKLMAYRNKILMSKDINDLFYQLETTNELLIRSFKDAEELDVKFLEHEEKNDLSNNWWSELKQMNNKGKYKKVEQQERLKKYITGNFFGATPTRIFTQDEGVNYYLEDFLVTEEEKSTYSTWEGREYYQLQNLIKLPRKLCALQLLENGEFSRILGSNLDYDEPLALFSAKKITSISIEELPKMFRFGLLEGNYETVKEKISVTQTILQKVKK